MTRASAAKKLAAAAAFGGGGMTAIGASLYGLLRAEASFARRRIGPAELVPPDPTGVYGERSPGPELRLAVLGDSAAAGYGVHRAEDTPGGRLAAAVSESADRLVRLGSFTVVGAETRDLGDQVTKAIDFQPHVAVIVIGANDVTHVKRLPTSVRLLRDQVRRLREAGVEVVVGTCPDLGTIRPIKPPLRQVARAASRRLAAAQVIAVVEAGGRAVALADLLAREFVKLPTLMFGPDQFHPSAAGYARLASVLTPTVLAAAGLAPESEPVLGGEVLPIADAAAEAAEHPGAQVEPSEATSRGRLARLRLGRRTT